MKNVLWLDDVRAPPNDEGATYFHVYIAKEAVEALKTRKFDVVCLDHDLGPEETCGNGYQVLTWIEEQDFTLQELPIIFVHTQNPVAYKRMCDAVSVIKKRALDKSVSFL